jgi:serine/threonine protein kinase
VDVENGDADGSLSMLTDNSQVPILPTPSVNKSLSKSWSCSLNSPKVLHDRWMIDSEDLVTSESDVIGRGGFGVVRKDVWKDGKRRYLVAVKEFSSPDAVVEFGPMRSGGSNSSNQSWENIVKEADLMVTLRSPFIVQVLGLCPPTALVMELMTHGPLHLWIRHRAEDDSKPPAERKMHKKDSLVQRFQFMQDCVRGLDYLHEHGVIHRDLKSPNILLCEEGGALKAKISDFGLARFVHSNVATSKDHAMSLL